MLPFCFEVPGSVLLKKILINSQIWVVKTEEKNYFCALFSKKLIKTSQKTDGT